MSPLKQLINLWDQSMKNLTKWWFLGLPFLQKKRWPCQCFLLFLFLLHYFKTWLQQITLHIVVVATTNNQMLTPTIMFNSYKIVFFWCWKRCSEVPTAHHHSLKTTRRVPILRGSKHGQNFNPLRAHVHPRVKNLVENFLRWIQRTVDFASL